MLLDVESGELRDLGGKHPSSPNIGPGGDVLYYASEVVVDDGLFRPTNRYELIRLDLRTSVRDVLFETEGRQSYLSPVLSPDGSKLAFSTHSEDASSSFGNQHILDLRSGVVSDVLGTDAFGRAWLPDSSGLLVAIANLWLASEDAEPAVLWDGGADVFAVAHSPVDDRIVIQTSERRATEGGLPSQRCAIELVADLERIQAQPLYVAPDDLCISLRDWSPDGSRLLVSLWWPQGIGPGHEPLEQPPVEDTHHLLDLSTGALHHLAVGDALRPVSWRPEW